MCRGCAYIAIYAQHVHSPELSTFTNYQIHGQGTRVAAGDSSQFTWLESLIGLESNYAARVGVKSSRFRLWLESSQVILGSRLESSQVILANDQVKSSQVKYATRVRVADLTCYNRDPDLRVHRKWYCVCVSLLVWNLIGSVFQVSNDQQKLRHIHQDLFWYVIVILICILVRPVM